MIFQISEFLGNFSATIFTFNFFHCELLWSQRIYFCFLIFFLKPKFTIFLFFFYPNFFSGYNFANWIFFYFNFPTICVFQAFFGNCFCVLIFLNFFPTIRIFQTTYIRVWEFVRFFLLSKFFYQHSEFFQFFLLSHFFWIQFREYDLFLVIFRHFQFLTKFFGIGFWALNFLPIVIFRLFCNFFISEIFSQNFPAFRISKTIFVGFLNFFSMIQNFHNFFW